MSVFYFKVMNFKSIFVGLMKKLLKAMLLLIIIMVSFDFFIILFGGMELSGNLMGGLEMVVLSIIKLLSLFIGESQSSYFGQWSVGVMCDLWGFSVSEFKFFSGGLVEFIEELESNLFKWLSHINVKCPDVLVEEINALIKWLKGKSSED